MHRSRTDAPIEHGEPPATWNINFASGDNQMTRNTTEKERKELAEKAEVRETSQPYTSEVEDRAAERIRNDPASKQNAPGKDSTERAAP
jgi:hypothetical protein